MRSAGLLVRGRGSYDYASADVRSPGFLHIQCVLEDTGRRNLINHFTVVPAADASFVQAAVGRNTAEALIDQVHRHRKLPGCEFRGEQLGIVDRHPRGRVFLAFHRPRQANEHLHGSELGNKTGDDPDIGILFGVPVQRFVGRGED